MFDQLRVSAIAAVADNGVIGADGDLPWHLPGDLRYFKRVTRGHAIIMGRKTWETLPKPLPQRLNVVLSTQLPPVEHPRVVVVRSADAALRAAAAWERAAAERAVAERAAAPAAGRASAQPWEPEIMVVGGGGVYALLWPWVDRFYRTLVRCAPRGDAHIAPSLLDGFVQVASDPVAADATTGSPAHDFQVWERR